MRQIELAPLLPISIMTVIKDLMSPTEYRRDITISINVRLLNQEESFHWSFGGRGSAKTASTSCNELPEAKNAKNLCTEITGKSNFR